MKRSTEFVLLVAAWLVFLVAIEFTPVAPHVWQSAGLVVAGGVLVWRTVWSKALNP